MKTFMLCYKNKPDENGADYIRYFTVNRENGTTLEEVWDVEHNEYEMGSVVTITDLETWNEKTFYK